MPPSVLDRNDVEPSDSAPDAATTAAERPSRRGPKNRPTYRVWEYATWRVRMRAWCNLIKQALIGDDCDLERPQTYKVVQSDRSPVENASTWLTWWSGDAIPRPGHIRAVERLAPGSSRLLDLTEVRTPELRQLRALDLLNTRFRATGRPVDFQREECHRLFITLNNAWSPFLDPHPTQPTSMFSLETQLGGEEEARLVHDVLLGAAELAWVRDGGNLRRAALPRCAWLEHSWLEPPSILRFLGLLSTFNELDNFALLKMWAYDFASAAMVIRTQLELAQARGIPILRLGRAGIVYAIAHNTFWAPASAQGGTKVVDMIRLLLPESVQLVRERLHAARVCYYNGFERWGIPEKAVRALNGEHRLKTWDEAFNDARARF